MAATASAAVYHGQIYGQSVNLEVKPIIPGLGVMVVSADEVHVGNIGWYLDQESGFYYGSGEVVFAVDGEELTLFSPVWAVFREVK